MVDNFELIKSYMEKQMLHGWTDGDCYYLQLLRRQSDDPMTDGQPDPRYHGNMHSRSIKDYLVPSIDYLEKIKPDVIKLCREFNVRAYIRLNKRNYKNIALEMLKHIADQCSSGGSFSSPYHLVDSACGNTCQAGDDKTWIMDLDDEYLSHKDKIIDMFCQCMPISNTIQKYLTEGLFTGERAKEFFLAENILEVPTKHGIHLICPPFNRTEMNCMWTSYCIDNKIPMPLPQMNIRDRHYDFDSTCIRYYDFSLTGIYLERKDDFLACCRKFGNAELQKIDRNKSIVHTGPLDISRLKTEWHDYGIRENFWMKCFDIHTDNPTVLFIP